jgi:hypothetical protein
MKIVGPRYHKLNMFLLRAIGLYLFISGARLVYRSSFDIIDFEQISGPISEIRVFRHEGLRIRWQSRLLIQVKNHPDKIFLDHTDLKDKLTKGDSITVYILRNPAFLIASKNIDVYGLFRGNEVLVDLMQTSRNRKWTGIIQVLVGIVIICFAFIYYKYTRREKYSSIDMNSDQLV